jgi:hypothetical protein
LDLNIELWRKPHITGLAVATGRDRDSYATFGGTNAIIGAQDSAVEIYDHALSYVLKFAKVCLNAGFFGCNFGGLLPKALLNFCNLAIVSGGFHPKARAFFLDFFCVLFEDRTVFTKAFNFLLQRRKFLRIFYGLKFFL